MIALPEAGLLQCCGSSTWVARMLERGPFADREALFDASDAIFRDLSRADLLEAFAAHPRIGSRKDVDKKAGNEKSWAEGEQAGTARTTDDVLAELARVNAAYEERFGYIYIICATGKSAEEMLAIAKSRLKNSADAELPIAAEEQRKITRIRLNKLLEST